MPPAMIQLIGVHKSFAGIPVLRGVDLSIDEGESVVLLGQSGSGKSVLMKLIVGLYPPDRGEVIVDGQDLSRLPRDELDAHWRKLGILFQADALFDSLSVFDNVAFPLRELKHLRGREVRDRVERALRLVDLSGIGGEAIAELSGGMRKRVAFARAAVLEPKILLYDEPTSGLDPLTTERVCDVIERGRRALGATALLISSDLAVAFRLADRLAFLHEGRIIFEGTAEALRHSALPPVAAYIQSWKEREAVARGLGPGASSQ